MSKPSGRGASKVGVRAIAQSLGLRSNEISQYAQPKLEPPKTYPPLPQEPLPLEMTAELSYMADLKEEFMQRFHSSSFYNRKAGKRDVRRYIDKYGVPDKAPLEPHWDRLPAELDWRKGGGATKRPTKRRKVDPEALQQKLEKLSRRENQPEKEGEQEPDKDDEEKEEENADEDADNEAISDEDYMEEGNDYAMSYFDNGDAYAEGSDDDDEG